LWILLDLFSLGSGLGGCLRPKVLQRGFATTIFRWPP